MLLLTLLKVVPVSFGIDFRLHAATAATAAGCVGVLVRRGALRTTSIVAFGLGETFGLVLRRQVGAIERGGGGKG